MRLRMDRALAADVLRRMPPEPRRQLRSALRELLKDPYPTNPNVDVRRLEADPAKAPVYRLKSGAWRAIFLVEGSAVEVVRVMRRDEGYDWLE